MSTLRLSLKHAHAYRALMLEAYSLQEESPTSTMQERASLPLIWWEQRVAPSHSEMIYGAFDEYQLVGSACMNFETQGRGRNKVSVSGMYITATHRQRGLGKQLVYAMLSEARKHEGVTQMQLSVATGHTPVQHLYKICGFEVTGIERPALRGTKQVSQTHMSRNIR